MGGLYVFALDSGEVRFVANRKPVACMPLRVVLFVRGGSLVAQHFDRHPDRRG